jgi:hypothetical protein
MIKVFPPVPRVCPECGACEGYPFVARTVLGRRSQLEIEVRCRACKHEFRVIIEKVSDVARADG